MLLSLKIWFLAIRPKTLSAGIAPVILGTAIAARDRAFDLFPFLAALIGALLIQIGTNLANDYYDCKKGADRPDRKGPRRATADGRIQPHAMRNAFWIVFSLAGLISVYLIIHAGWIICAIAVSAILSGWFYTAGPKPLGYIGLGEIFVFVFFGPVASAGTYYVQTLRFSPESLLVGIIPGLLSVAILTVNNLRDINEDKISEKKTLAVRFGALFSQWEYTCSVAAAAFFAMGHVAATKSPTYAGIILIPFLFYGFPLFNVWRHPASPILNASLAQTGALQFISCLIYAKILVS